MRRALHSVILLGAAVLLVGEATLQADLVPPGYHGIRHEIYFEGMDQLADYEFYLYPQHVGNGVVKIEAGKNTNFYHLISPAIYAVKKGTDVPLEANDEETEAFFKDDSIPRSQEIDRISNLPNRDRTQKIKTVYKIKAIEKGKLVMEKASEKYYDKDGKELGKDDRISLMGDPWLQIGGGGALTLAVLTAGMVWIRRRRQPVTLSP